MPAKTKKKVTKVNEENDKQPKECKGLSFEDCELAILRMQVDAAEKRQGQHAVQSKEVQTILAIVDKFIRTNELIAYGGFAIDALLPDSDKIYDKDAEIPDYDVFSKDAIKMAKRLGDDYAKAGYVDVEVKSGQHYGTYKVYVNFIPVADITQIPPELFATIKRNARRINGMLFADPNLLRMGMYLELSRPDGDVSRFEKVLKRLILLNKHYPLSDNLNAANCAKKAASFQRALADPHNKSPEKSEKIYTTVLSALIDQGVVFFGGYAIALYSAYMPKELRATLEKFADFDVLSDTPEATADHVKSRLIAQRAGKVVVLKHDAVGEIIPEHYEVRVGRDTVAFVYSPVACHSYNVVRIDGKAIKVATIDTMLSFYLAFLYADRPYFDHTRIICMAQFLFDVQQKNRLSQRGLLKRFSISCYGHQETVEEMKGERAEKYRELHGDRRRSDEYQAWFLNYKPGAAPLSSPNGDKKRRTRRRRRRRNSRKGFFWGGVH